MRTVLAASLLFFVIVADAGPWPTWKAACDLSEGQKCALVRAVLEAASQQSCMHACRGEECRDPTSRKLLVHATGSPNEYLLGEAEKCIEADFEVLQRKHLLADRQPPYAIDVMLSSSGEPRAFKFVVRIITFPRPGSWVGNVFCGQTHGTIRWDGKIWATSILGSGSEPVRHKGRADAGAASGSDANPQ